LILLDLIWIGGKCSIRLTSTNTLGVVALAEETVDTTNGESETSLGRTAEERRQVRMGFK
jgi:hypothetical protein